MYVAECMYGMVLFSRKLKCWRKNKKQKVIRKLYSGTDVQIFFLNKYFIEVEELLAIKRIVLIMAFIIHSSIYWAPTYGAQHLLLQATLIFQEWCLTLFLLMWSSNQCV